MLSPHVVLNVIQFLTLFYIGSDNFTYVLSMKYDRIASPDIRWSDGIVDPCNTKYTLPCWQFSHDRGVLDVFIDRLEHFNNLTVDGRTGTYSVH